VSEAILDEYQLLDSGNGKKWEQLGPLKIVRPASVALWRPEQKNWPHDLEYIRNKKNQGEWIKKSDKAHKYFNESFKVDWGNFVLKLKFTPFGHTGVFSEQEANWKRIHKKCQQSPNLNVINLFAYTGGSTFAAASAGAKVCHVDASKSTVAWARQNAELNNIENVQWIVEDAFKYVKRCVQRGVKFDGIILDPPSYGRGPKGEIWKLEESLASLLDSLSQLQSDNFKFLLLSCHSNGIGSYSLSRLASNYFDFKTKDHGPMFIESDKAQLNAGDCVWMENP